MMPVAGTSTVEAPSVENVIVDAPVVGSTERAVVDFADINASNIPGVTPAAAPAAPVGNNASVPDVGFNANTGFVPESGYDQPQVNPVNQGFAQPQNFAQPQGFTQPQGYAQAPVYPPSPENFGYDYGYNKDIQEYGQPSFVPDGFYSNDPFSSYYYEDEPPAPKPNGMAVAALVLGIASLTMFFSCIGWIPGIIAIPLGIMGIGKCRSKGMARAGMIMGIIGTFAGLSYLLYYIFDRIV